MVVDGDNYSKGLETRMHQTIKKVSQDFEQLKFNTAIAAMMALINDFYAAGSVTNGEMRTFILLLSPVAPHICEEMWQNLGFSGRVYAQKWPEWEEDKTIENTVEIAIQINGKVRSQVTVTLDEQQDTIKERVMADEAVQKFTEGKKIVKEIYISGRIYNIVVK